LCLASNTLCWHFNNLKLHGLLPVNHQHCAWTSC
jgi:hypothetical protein